MKFYTHCMACQCKHDLMAAKAVCICLYVTRFVNIQSWKEDRFMELHSCFSAKVLDTDKF